MLCFSRDTEIGQCIQSDFANIAKSKQYEGPPSGVVPFHGICMFGISNDKQSKIIVHFASEYIQYVEGIISLQPPHSVTSSMRPSNCILHFVHFTSGIVIVWHQSIHIRRVLSAYVCYLRSYFKRTSRSFGHISVNCKFNRMPIWF